MPSRLIRFEQFELDAGAFELRRAGRAVRLERIPLELLFFLAERRGQLVTREEILERIWGKDVFVDADNSINTAVRKVRSALKDDPDKPRFVCTVPGKGYRFAPEVLEHRLPGADFSAPAAGGRVDSAVPLTAPKVKLVVLPFVNLSHDFQQEFFADGITEEIITRLGGLDPQRLGVIARTSSMQYKTAQKDAAQIARELGVDYLLEGSVRRDGERLRVTAQLIVASDQTHVWCGNFDRSQSDVLRLQSDLALAISNKIALKVSPPVRARLADAPPVNPEAYQAYLLALKLWDTRTKSAALRSVSEHQHAISLEPDYAPPYAALANVYSLASVVGTMTAHEGMPQAKQAALRAIALDDALATGHTVLAFVLAHYDYDWPHAEREFRRALELNPNDASAHFFFSNSYLSPMGRHDEAIEEMHRAIELDPFSPPVQSFFGQALLWARRYDEALAQYKKCADLFPGFAINHERMAHLYTYLDRFEEAISEDTKAKLLVGQSPEAAMQHAHTLRTALDTEGPGGYWKSLLEFSQLPDAPPESYKDAFHFAIIHTRLRQQEEALASLEKAYDERNLSLTELTMEPAFDPLHSDPRFQALARRLGLPLLAP